MAEASIMVGKFYGWMDERCFRPLLCTIKAELGRGQPGLMRWIWDETLPQSSIDRSTLNSAAHRATKWASGRPQESFMDEEGTTIGRVYAKINGR